MHQYHERDDVPEDAAESPADYPTMSDWVLRRTLWVNDDEAAKMAKHMLDLRKDTSPEYRASRQSGIVASLQAGSTLEEMSYFFQGYNLGGSSGPSCPKRFAVRRRK
jgi:hypothetical protein